MRTPSQIANRDWNLPSAVCYRRSASEPVNPQGLAVEVLLVVWSFSPASQIVGVKRCSCWHEGNRCATETLEATDPSFLVHTGLEMSTTVRHHGTALTADNQFALLPTTSRKRKQQSTLVPNPTCWSLPGPGPARLHTVSPRSIRTDSLH